MGSSLGTQETRDGWEDARISAVPDTYPRYFYYNLVLRLNSRANNLLVGAPTGMSRG